MFLFFKFGFVVILLTFVFTGHNPPERRFCISKYIDDDAYKSVNLEVFEKNCN
jgi:hypothetical protein